MSSNYKSKLLKVFAGYILLTGLLIFSVDYVYKEMKSLPDVEQESGLMKRRKAMNQFISRLYKAEITAQSLSIGHDNYANYQNDLMYVEISIQQIKTLLSDSIQISRLDTLSSLLIEKEKNMGALMALLQESSAHNIYDQTIEKTIESHRHQQNEKRLNNKHISEKVTQVKVHKRRSFLKRLADVFTGGDADSTTITNTREEVLSDTLLNSYNPVDTLTTLLRTIQKDVNNGKSKKKVELDKKSEELQAHNILLSNKVSNLIYSFENEEQNHWALKQRQENEVRSRSTRAISTIAISSIILCLIFLILIGRDIVESHHYRTELEKAQKQTQELLVLREKIMLTITHDIKAPLGSILGYIELLARMLKDNRKRFYLNNMKYSASHLLNLVSSFLDFHRLESHKMELNYVPFNPKQLFDTLNDNYRLLARKHELAFYYENDDSLDNFFISDPFRMRQIAENLLSNALKFTKKGSITLQTRLDGDKLYFSVTDTGDGISPEDQKKLFEAFTRLRNAQGEEGVGLGLNITQRLVELLKGKITLQSELEKGSTFEVCLPLLKTDKKGIDLIDNTLPEVIAHKKDIRLILIDDDRIQLNLTSEMLKHVGLEATCCESAELLFKLLEEKPYDILLTDIQMPEMNGFDLLKSVRQLESPRAAAIPIIAITARSEMSRQTFEEQGFAGCLHKPFTLNEMVTEINHVLAIENFDLSMEEELLEENYEDTDNATEVKEVTPFKEPEDAASKINKQLNFKALTIFSEGDDEASKQIIKTFIEESEKERELLLQYLENNDLDKIKAKAHKLLPHFALLEAKNCQEIFGALEHTEEKTVTENIRQKVLFVCDEMVYIINEAKKFFNSF